MKTKIISTFSIILIFHTGSAQQLFFSTEPIAEEKGIYGYICPLFGLINYSNNLIGQLNTIKPDLNENQSIFDPPVSQNDFLFSLPFEFGYTIRPQKTKVYLQNSQENFMLFETSQQIGIMQRLKARGVLNLGFTWYGLGTKVWEDPFGSNTNKKTAYKNGLGFEISLHEISSTGLALQYKYRTIQISTENSGLQVDLLPEQLKMMDRNGSRHSLSVLYNYSINENHTIVPDFNITRDITTGSSLSGTGYKAGIAYALKKTKLSLSAGIYSMYFAYDSKNPVYNIKQENNAWEIQGTFFYTNPWDIKLFSQWPFQFVLKTGYYAIDSNIDFYSHDALLVQAGIFTKW